MVKARVDIEKVRENEGSEELISFLEKMMKEVGYVTGELIFLVHIQKPDVLRLDLYPLEDKNLYPDEFIIIPDVILELEDML